jgi:hypothetical protein
MYLHTFRKNTQDLLTEICYGVPENLARTKKDVFRTLGIEPDPCLIVRTGELDFGECIANLRFERMTFWKLHVKTGIRCSTAELRVRS